MSSVLAPLPRMDGVPRRGYFNRRWAASYFATLAFIGLSYWIVTRLSNFHQAQLQGGWQLGMFDIDWAMSTHRLFVVLLVLYVIVLIPYYAFNPWLRSNAFVFTRGLGFSLTHRRVRPTLAPGQMSRLPVTFRLTRTTRQAGLALLLKFFFAPLMLNWCLNHLGDLSGAIAQLIDGVREGQGGRELFDGSLFWAAFQMILFVDTLLFTLGYLIELPALRNRIRSVDPTLLGWLVCLACYPPFNEFTLRYLEWQSGDFPHFETTWLHYLVNVVLLAALGIYSWASLALGFKASNLTNRGIVTRGPYGVVRHPAYVAKNLAWWLGALPGLYTTMLIGNVQAIVYSFLALIGWSAIYTLRALTEERHLLMSDNGYAEYVQRVRWRFIPGVV
jgi:protein-S-isoprenylcysteine O-methyltransferase Ste14